MRQALAEYVGVAALGTLLSYAAFVKPYHHKDYERWRQNDRQDLIEEDRSIAKRNAVVMGVLFIPSFYLVGRVALAVIA